MLTCLARALTYNLEKGQQESTVLSSSAKKKPRRASKIMPPTATQRERVRANLKAAAAELKRYDTLLYELEPYFPFEDNGLCPKLTPPEANILLPRLLGWAERLLTERSIGNARTIESVGQLAPCAYVDVVASRQKSHGTQRVLPLLKSVAELLNECQIEKLHSAEQLSETLRRFKREYPDIHRRLRAKLSSLHDEPGPKVDDWREAYRRDMLNLKSPKP